MDNFITELKKSPNYLGDIEFKGYHCLLMKQHYASNDRVALQLIDKEDGGPVAMATVNIPDAELADGEIIVKNYSENEGMLEALVTAGYAEDTRRSVASGFISAPVCKLLKHGTDAES
jgi:hypothetical protein